MMTERTTAEAGSSIVLTSGRVRRRRSDSFASLEEYFWSRVEKTDGCWLWKVTSPTMAYGIFSYGKFRQYAHRYSFALVHGPIPAGMYICHHCDNPPCVRPNHLFAGTAKDNAADMRNKGRDSAPPHFLGERHPLAKLTDDAVMDARRRRAMTGESYQSIAKSLGLNSVTIRDAVRGESWGHLSSEVAPKRVFDGLTFAGRTQSLRAWAAELGIPSQTISRRIKVGWSIESALSTPSPTRTPMPTLSHAGETMTVRAWAKRLGVHSHTIYWRIKHGWPIDRVLSGENLTPRQIGSMHPRGMTKAQYAHAKHLEQAEDQELP